MITEIDDYFTRGCGRCDRFDTDDCSTRLWAAGLAGLRRICRASGADEALRWGHPCYRHAGRNLAIIGAFRGDYRLSFFEAGLLSDPDGVLERQGENTTHPDMIRFTDPDGPARAEAAILSLLRQAMDHAAAGRRMPKATTQIDLPEELVAALDADQDLAEAFHALTPGRQRSYAINLSAAKQSATRVARIDKFRDRILSGKGATEL